MSHPSKLPCFDRSHGIIRMPKFHVIKCYSSFIIPHSFIRINPLSPSSQTYRLQTFVTAAGQPAWFDIYSHGASYACFQKLLYLIQQLSNIFQVNIPIHAILISSGISPAFYTFIKVCIERMHDTQVSDSSCTGRDPKNHRMDQH
jgi:hypothetical protein